MIEFEIDENGRVPITETMKIIEYVLKESFPDVPMTAALDDTPTGSIYIQVGWVDGPSERQVEDVCAIFDQERMLDGKMTFVARRWLGQTIRFDGFVFTNRTLSEKAKAEVRAEARRLRNVVIDVPGQRPVTFTGPDQVVIYLTPRISFTPTTPSAFLAMFTLSQPSEILRVA